MQKPKGTILKLVALGWIHGLHIEQQQTGTDTAETFCKITGSNGKLEGKWETYKEYLDVAPGHNYIAEVKRRHVNEVADWRTFEKENKKDLVEFERLKAKLNK